MGGQLRVVVNGNNGRIVNTAPAYDSRFAYQPVRPRGLVPMHSAAWCSAAVVVQCGTNSELKDDHRRSTARATAAGAGRTTAEFAAR